MILYMTSLEFRILCVLESSNRHSRILDSINSRIHYSMYSRIQVSKYSRISIVCLRHGHNVIEPKNKKTVLFFFILLHVIIFLQNLKEKVEKQSKLPTFLFSEVSFLIDDITKSLKTH